MTSRSAIRILLACLAATLAHAMPAQAQESTNDYPKRPIRIIVPFSAGGSVDVLARTVGQKLSERLGQSVIVEDRPGAGTIIGTEAVVRSPADGYTLLMAVSNLATVPALQSKLPYDAQKDLVPISLLARTPVVIYANVNFKPKNIKELVEYAKTHPNAVNFGSGGTGTTSHLTGELLKEQSGTAMSHVSYKGGTQAMNDAIAGHIPISFHTVGQSLAQYKAGQLQALGVSSAQRYPIISEVPTFREQGFDIVTSEWYGLLAPAGTPRPIIDKLNAQLKEIMALPGLGEPLPAIELVSSTPEEFGQLIDSETRRWGALIHKLGIKQN